MSSLRTSNQPAQAPMMKQAKKPRLSSRNSCPKRSVELFPPFGYTANSDLARCWPLPESLTLTTESSTEASVALCCSKLSINIMQEQKKKELEELNAMLAEMGVAPKESDAGAEGTAPTGKKKKKKEKAAVRDGNATSVNGNGVAPAEQPKAEDPSSEQPQQESIEVLSDRCTWHVPQAESAVCVCANSNSKQCHAVQLTIGHLVCKHCHSVSAYCVQLHAA